MAIGSLYQLTHRQTLFGETMMNVYHYLGAAAPATADDLIDAFQAVIIPQIQTIQVSQVAGRDITVISVGDFADFAQQSDPFVGGFGDTGLDNSFQAVNITLRTNIRNIGPASKRYSGLPSTLIAGNYITDPDLIEDLNTLGDLLCDSIGTGGSGDTYTPVCVKRIKVIGVPPQKDFYRMPETIAEAEWANLTTALVSLKISHQVSRGNGR